MDSTHGTVYNLTDCAGKNTGYSNYPELSSTIHAFDSNGFCSCAAGMYEPAFKNSSGVYEITNAGELFWFAALVNGDKTHADFDAQDTAAKAKLMKDITIPRGHTWTPIGKAESAKFTGTLTVRTTPSTA